MRQLLGRLGTPLERLLTALWAGLLWTFASIPLITLLASTTALATVITERRRNNDTPTWRLFTHAFLTHLRQTLPAALLLGAAALVLAADLTFGLTAPATLALRVPATAAAVLGATVATGTTAFLTDLLIHHPARLRTQLRNALLLSLASIGTTLLCTALLTAGVLLSYLAAPLLPLLGYLVVLAHHRLTTRAVASTLRRAEHQRQTPTVTAPVR